MAYADEVIKTAIKRHGAMSFSDLMAIALYDVEIGFYQNQGRAGRRGDFITNPEVGPLFGHLIARYIDKEWNRCGCPDPFFLFDVGAGPGTLVRSVIDAEPECLAALRVVLVEVSAVQRDIQKTKLSLEPPESVVGNVISCDDEHYALPRQGPIVCSVANVPSISVDGVVICNELFDNLPFDIAHFNGKVWNELRVASRSVDSTYEWVELGENEVGDLGFCSTSESDIATQSWLAEKIPNPPVNACVPILNSALVMLGDLLSVIRSGSIVALDYGAKSSVLAQRSPYWLRTFKEQQRGVSPLVALGQQDITADVPFDQLSRTVAPSSLSTQVEFLNGLGINELVTEGKAIWAERAHLGDLAAIKARSRVGEAEALLDEDGLGGFVVAEWVV